MDNKFITDHFKGGHIYSFVGAGGKTSSLKRIGAVLIESGYRVLITTTTKFGKNEFPDEIVKICSSIDLELPLNSINVQVSGIKGEKYLGFDKEMLEGAGRIPIDTVILVEADGARRCEFKVPYEHEPVIPSNSAAAFLLISSGIIGEEATDQNTYNLDGVRRIIGDDNLFYTNENIVKLISHGWLSDSNFKNLKVVFNQGDRLASHYSANELLLDMKLKLDVDCYLVSLKEEKTYLSHEDRIGALILAAGEGSRMKGIKQLLEIKGSTFLEETIKKYSGLAQDLIVTIGYHKDEIKMKIPEKGFIFQEIRDYQEGMSASFREARKFDCDCFFVAPCDLPLIEGNTLHLLLEKWKLNRNRIVVPRFRGRNGHPVIMPSFIQDSFYRIRGDIGARELIKEMGCIFLDVDDPGILADVDTYEEYIKIREVIDG